MLTTRRSKNVQGPQFLQYLNPVLTALQELDSSARPNEVVSRIISSQSNISEEEKEILPRGTTRIENNIHWARFYLTKADYIDGSKRGIWILTEKGRLSSSLSSPEIMDVFLTVQSQFGAKSISNENNSIPSIQEATNSVEQAELIDSLSFREKLRTKILDLTDRGFETFCKELLLKSGFHDVSVTGGTGDGGIDGYGTLKVNPFVSFRIAFQCKKYKESSPVDAAKVREFRGSFGGSADKGIFLTTSRFTEAAQKEATKDGKPPVELIDGDDLIALLEQLEIGLKNKRTITTFDIDEDFFSRFN